MDKETLHPGISCLSFSKTSYKYIGIIKVPIGYIYDFIVSLGIIILSSQLIDRKFLNHKLGGTYRY